MNEMGVRHPFSVYEGFSWENKNGPSSIGDIVQATSLRRELVYGALGWLGRENKISVEMQGRPRGRRTMVFSLRQ